MGELVSKLWGEEREGIGRNRRVWCLIVPFLCGGSGEGGVGG